MAIEVGNVPAQPVYGEVQQIEAQEKAAPFPAEMAPISNEATGAPVISDQGTAAAAPVAEVPPDVGEPSPDNIVSVLPPTNTNPALTGQRPLRPEQQLAFIIMGTPGMSPITRSFAQQILAYYRAENRLPAQNLRGPALQEYQDRMVKTQLPPTEEEAEA